MATSIDSVAVSIFATKGIVLSPVEKRDYCWTFSPYRKDEPAVKNLEVFIRRGDYMGQIVHRAVIPAVHFEGSHATADKVLADYLATQVGSV